MKLFYRLGVGLVSLIIAFQAIPSINTPNAISPNMNSIAHSESNLETEKKSDLVYITNSGKCYHKSGCRHLTYGSTEIDKQTAEKLKYRPCKHCFK